MDIQKNFHIFFIFYIKSIIYLIQILINHILLTLSNILNIQKSRKIQKFLTVRYTTYDIYILLYSGYKVDICTIFNFVLNRDGELRYESFYNYRSVYERK